MKFHEVKYSSNWVNEEDLAAFGKWKIDCTQIVLALRTLRFSHCFILKLNS